MAKESKLVPLALLFAFNVFQFSTYVLGVPPLFLLSRGVLVLLVLGGLLRLLYGEKWAKAQNMHLKGLVSVESAEKLTRLVYNKAKLATAHAESILLWQDPAKSLSTLVLVYLLSLVLKVVPSVLVVFFLVWGLFLYVYVNEFFQKNVYKYLEPYTGKLTDLVQKVYNTIPRLKDDKLL